MKKVLSTLILAVLAIAVCCFCLFYVVAVSHKAKDSVDNIQSDITTSDYEAAREEVQNLDEILESHHTMLSALVHHSVLEEIEESITVLKTLLERTDENEKAEFWFESSRALARIKNLRDLEIPSVGNIL